MPRESLPIRDGQRTIDKLDASVVFQTGQEAGYVYGFGYWGRVEGHEGGEGKLAKYELPEAHAIRTGGSALIWEHGEEFADPKQGGTIHKLNAEMLITGINYLAKLRKQEPWEIVDNCDGADADLCVQFGCNLFYKKGAKYG